VTDVWWARGAEEEAHLVPGPGPSGVQPELVDATREAVRAAVRDRIPGYTPDWTNPDRQDAGVALVRLFGTQAEPVLTRVNRLPEKILAEHLDTAGVRRRPATAAAALLEFTVTPPDGLSVLVPAGFQAAASTPDGQLVYETDQDVHATPAALTAVVVQHAGTLEPVPLGPAGPGRAFAPFGTDPQPGDALWLGLAGSAGPFPSLTLGFVIAAAPPDPRSHRSRCCAGMYWTAAGSSPPRWCGTRPAACGPAARSNSGCHARGHPAAHPADPGLRCGGCGCRSPTARSPRRRRWSPGCG
jgi:hypothetical protein